MSMRNTIASLALLKVNWDHLKRDYLENFLPFIATLCVRKGYDIIDPNMICNDFSLEYGLWIPYHPMMSILARAKSRGILKQHHHKLYPVKDKIIELDFTERSKDQDRQNQNLISGFIAYAYSTFSLVVSPSDAEKAFLAMVQQRDLDILFAAQEGRLFPEIEAKKGYQFILSKFIQHIESSEPALFSFILNMAVGHVLASAILYADFARFQGKLAAIEVYFDTRFVLRALGTEGKERQRHYLEFLRVLSEEKAILRVFRHTYDEMMTVLSNCLKWVENSAYDPSRGSITCNYFVQNGYKESDVERFIIITDMTLADLKIEVIDGPDPQDYELYQIDEETLKKTIVERYKTGNAYFFEVDAESTLLRDIKSISSIYRLRKGRKPNTLSKAGSLFVTTNAALAHASYLFQQSQNEEGFVFPTCVTDVFLGTFTWLQSPARVTSINRRRMIADCYAAVQPSKVLMKKYLQEIERLKNDQKVTEDEYYLLRTHRTALNLLENLTLGDPDNFSDKTPEEILEAMRAEIQCQVSKSYLEARQKLELAESELKQTKEASEVLVHRINGKVKHIANVVGWGLFGLLSTAFAVGLIIQTGKIGESLTTGWVIIVWGVTGIIGLLNVVAGFNIIGFRNSIVSWLAAKLKFFIAGGGV
jgi:hypothetical protein